MNVQKKIFDLIDELAEINIKDLQLDTDFRQDLGLSSLNIAEFAIAIEDEFNIRIPNEVSAKIQTVDDLISAVKGEINLKKDN